MRRTCICISAILAIGIVQSAWAQDPRKPGPDPAEWVPAEALVYVGVTDTQRCWANYKKTINYQVMTDDDLAKAGGMANIWGTVLDKVKQRLAHTLDVDPSELKSPFAGPLALYATAPPGGGFDDVEPAMIAGVGDAELMKGYFDAVVARLKDAADDYEAVTAAGGTIHVFTSETDEDEKAKEDEFDFDEPPAGEEAVAKFVEEAIDKVFSLEHLPPKLALCLTPERLIVAGSADHIRSVLAGSTSSDTLAGTEDHQALLRHRRPVGEVRLLVNLPRIFEMARAEAGDEDDVHKWLRVIGAGGLRSLIGHMRVGTRSYDSKVELLFLTRGERSGLAKLLSMENRPVAPPLSVPAAACAFASFNIDPPVLLDEILNMVAQQDPEAAEKARASLQEVQIGEQRVNMIKDVIEHLTGPLTVTVAFTKPYGPGSMKPLLSLGHRNRDALTRFVSILFAGLPPRDFQGTPIYTDPSGQMNLAVTDDRVLAGTQAAVEAALSASPAEGLADDATFRRAKRLVPEEAWCTFYVDTHKLMDGLMGLAAKQAELMGDPAMGLMFMLGMAGVDVSDTPENRKMLEYSPVGIMTIATTPDGVQVTYVVLKPQQE